jgi:hypothetical protein
LRALQAHKIGVHTDGEHLILNTEAHRQKYLNVEREPRITVIIRHEENPCRYAKLRGEFVEKVRGQEAHDNIDKLSRKYRDEDYPPRTSRLSG